MKCLCYRVWFCNQWYHDQKVETIVIIKEKTGLDIRGFEVHISRCKEINSVREDEEQPRNPQR